MGDLTTKQCRYCQQTKPLSGFHKDRKAAGGYSHKCKECRAAYFKQYRSQTRPKPVSVTEQICSRCNVSKPASEYFTDRGAPSGLRAHCKECTKKRTNIEYTLYRYKLTQEQYDRMMQEGCVVCGVTTDLVIDHDHSCCPGAITCGSCVRGVLCHRHNKAEGFLNSDPDECLALAAYLIKTRAGERQYG